MNSFLKIENLSKSFSGKDSDVIVFEDFTLQIQQNRIISILGPSGCGKSTFLRILTDIESEFDGKIIIGNSSVKEYNKDNKVGYVFQKAIFFPWKTIIENLLFAVELSKGRVSQEDKDYANHLLDKFNILESKNSYPNELSGGMLQRANVARALAMRPQLLLLDEPFNSIDEYTREAFWVDFRNIWKETDLTVILISHDIREAIFLGDEIIVLPNKPISDKTIIQVSLPEFRDAETLSSQSFFYNIQEVRKYIKLYNGK